MAVLDELGEAVASVATRVGASAVRVGGGWRGGSGVVIGSGAVLTNAHNVRSEEVTVTFADGHQASGTVMGMDVDGDLAVIAVDTGSAPTVEWASATAHIGTPVLAVTLNGNGPRVTFGFVSSVARAFRGPRGRRISGGLEHTAPLVPGSSGSALVDTEGRLVGLNTNRLGGGFYLALPADESLRSRVAALQRGESAERPRLGVGIAPSWVARRMRRAVGLPERDGVLVRDVEEGARRCLRRTGRPLRRSVADRQVRARHRGALSGGQLFGSGRRCRRAVVGAHPLAPSASSIHWRPALTTAGSSAAPASALAAAPSR
jgi:serine protease Do